MTPLSPRGAVTNTNLRAHSLLPAPCSHRFPEGVLAGWGFPWGPARAWIEGVPSRTDTGPLSTFPVSKEAPPGSTSLPGAGGGPGVGEDSGRAPRHGGSGSGVEGGGRPVLSIFTCEGHSPPTCSLLLWGHLTSEGTCPEEPLERLGPPGPCAAWRHPVRLLPRCAKPASSHEPENEEAPPRWLSGEGVAPGP